LTGEDSRAMSDSPSHSGSPPPDGAAVDDEPKTPMWLTALGVALFVVVAALWATSSAKSSSLPQGAGAPSSSAPSAPPSPATGAGSAR
jgi:hypothetical protein